MSSPFDKSGSLAVCCGRRTTQGNDTFEGAGRLFMVVTPAHDCVYIGDMTPREANARLISMGVSVRVDALGKPYVKNTEETS